MYEVEVKVRANHEAVRDALAATPATFRLSLEQRDRYFEAPHRDFAARDEALRIREAESNDRSVAKVTYKGPRLEGATKTRTEHETKVEDAQTMMATFEALGFEPVATVEKHRDAYDLGPATVTLDSVSGLGEFVEVEMTAEEAELDRTQEMVSETLADLGLAATEKVSESYLELLLAEADGDDQ